MDKQPGRHRKCIISASLLTLMLAITATGWLWILLPYFLTLFLGLIGFILGGALVISRGTKFQQTVFPSTNSFVTKLLIQMTENRKLFQPCERKVVTTHNLDVTLQEIINYIVRDYVISWYAQLGKDNVKISHLIEDEIWKAIENLSKRLASIDMVTLMTKDMINACTKHFQDIRCAKLDNVSGQRKYFTLHPWLANSESELDYLGKVAEMCIVYLLPQKSIECSAVRSLLREILANSIMYPCVEMICDPDYLNQKLYSWLDYRETLSYEHKRTYTVAATYEDFMKTIEQCHDLEHLKQMRYNIMSEIMHATSIQNLKRMKGIDTSKEFSAKGTSKGDLLRARNLPRYINQLTVCKQYCEKRLYLLGGSDYQAYDTEQQQRLPGKTILAYSVIMGHSDSRKIFQRYLKRHHKESLIQYWNAVQDFKQTPQKDWHKIGSEIYQMFIAHPTSLVRALVDRNTLKTMEAFIMGNTGREAFFIAQEHVYHELEEKHYPSFILSDIYHLYISNLSQSGKDISYLTSTVHSKEGINVRTNTKLKSNDKTPTKDKERIAAHSSYAHEKLDSIDEKIMNKTQALNAMRRSQKPDTRIVKVQEEIQQEIESLKSERRKLEFHIDRTELWAKHIGKWRAHIYNAEIEQVDGIMTSYFVIVINIPTSLVSGDAHSSDTQGWVITRTVEDFHALHNEIVEIMPKYKILQLPSASKLKAKAIDISIVNKAKDNLEKYLVCVLSDERLAQSEVVFVFFSPSPEHLKHPTDTSKQTKGKFSIANIFRTLPSGDSDSDDELLFADDDSAKDFDEKDSIAGPFYKLIQELCEIKGVFKWFRRTFIVFVKVTFGKSVNRQLHSFVDWLVSEPMLTYYLHLFRDAYWPEAVTPAVEKTHSVPVNERSTEDKVKMRYIAKEKMLQNIPEAVKNLVGDQNARRGAIKAFESLQEKRLNKHILYVMLEIFLRTIFPELEQFSNLPEGKSVSEPLNKPLNKQRYKRPLTRPVLYTKFP